MLQVDKMECTINSLVGSGSLEITKDTSRENWERIRNLPLPFEDYRSILNFAKTIGVTKEFQKIICLFSADQGNLPAGFCPRLVMREGQCVRVDLKRDISYGKNGVKRPTSVLFSADSANPYEVEPLRNIIANLTCNPSIIYNDFINNPKANIGNRFKDRYEVISELCGILGPGVDISVEIDNPFAPRNEILEEIAHFEEILTPYRLVVKVPHTGPVNGQNVGQLVDGEFPLGFAEGSVSDHFYGHDLAQFLTKKGCRVNFTLMFEPYQTALALQTKPYFINAFLKQRYQSGTSVQGMLQNYDRTGDSHYLRQIKSFMRLQDMISAEEENGPDAAVLEKARRMIEYRKLNSHEGMDGLDNVRHSLRLLKNSHLPDTRLIICSLAGDQMYPDIDKLLAEPEFEEMLDRVVITAPPAYLSRFACAPGVLTYQRMFLKAVHS